MNTLKEIRKNPAFKYLVALVVLSQIGLQSWRTLYNNFAVDVVGISGLQTGIIQSVRELPGLLTFLVIFVLMIINEKKFAVLSVFLMGVGILVTGYFESFNGLIVTTFIMSLGFHYFETANQSLTLQHFEKGQTPIVMARFKSLGALINIVVGLFIMGTTWLFFERRNIVVDYKYFFLVFGLIVIGGSIYLMIRKTDLKEMVSQKKKLFLKKKYWLYYVLSFLSGARRQVFIVFAIFMLVQKYSFTILEISILFIVNNIITYFISPLIGKAINKFGERKMLSIEYGFLIVIFLSYAFVENRYVVVSLYIADHIFFGFAMSINTFLQKIANKEDLRPTVSAGYAINHISAVIIPVIGGALYMYNWQLPFIGGAILAVLSFIFVQYIRIPINKN